MQGKERMDRELLDAGALAGRLVPERSMFAFLAAHRTELFPDTDFADLFTSGRGRPSIPASVMAAVLTLQALCDYSGAETAEAARCDLRWKVACGFAVDHRGFDPSTLVYWRRRLAGSARPAATGTGPIWHPIPRPGSSPMRAADSGRLDGNGEPDVAAGFVAAEHPAGEQAGDSPAPARDATAAGEGEDDACRWYGDSAYGTGELRDAIRDAGDQAVIKPRPLRRQCTTAAAGPTLQLHPHDQLLRAARARWAADPAVREDYKHHRPNAERAIAQVATSRGRRIKLRYRGTARNNAWLKRRAAAVNLRNLISRGLARQHGTRAVAAT